MVSARARHGSANSWITNVIHEYCTPCVKRCRTRCQTRDHLGGSQEALVAHRWLRVQRRNQRWQGVEHRRGPASATDAVQSGQAAAPIPAKLVRVSRSVLVTASPSGAGADRWPGIMTCDLALDTGTLAGEATASMMAVFSQSERRLSSQRTREALAVRKSRRPRLGRLPALPRRVAARIVGARSAGDSLRTTAAGLADDVVPTARGAAK
jgi:Resolvase, N terminal domain